MAQTILALHEDGARDGIPVRVDAVRLGEENLNFGCGHSKGMKGGFWRGERNAGAGAHDPPSNFESVEF